MDAVVGPEVEDAVDGGDPLDVARAGSGVDVLDHPRSPRRAVASPELVAVAARAVLGAEVEGPADVGEVAPGIGDLATTNSGSVTLDAGPGLMSLTSTAPRFEAAWAPDVESSIAANSSTSVHPSVAVWRIESFMQQPPWPVSR